MNNLFATWHRSAEADTEGDVEADVGELDPVVLLSRACDRLAGIPELRKAQYLVASALGEVWDWADGQVEPVTIRRR